MDGDMNLLVMTKRTREAVQEGEKTLEEFLMESRSEGVQCEVKGCRNESTEFLEMNDDDGRNVCWIHLDLVVGVMGMEERGSALRLIMVWDDDTQTDIHGKSWVEGSG